MNTPRLGFLLQGRWNAADARTGAVEVFRGAEALGAHTGWLAQHHFEAGRSPSPLVVLAAVAQATTRIGLGTATVMLPFENPVRLAEDAATVDLLSGGRLRLGLGSGFGLAYNATSARIDREFGVPGDDRGRHTERTLDRLLRLLRDRTVDADPTLSLQPAPGTLGRRLWRATSAPATARGAGRAGLGLLVSSNAKELDGRTDDSQLDLIHAHREGHADPGTEPPEVGVLRAVHIGDDHAALEARLAAEYRERIDAATAAGRLPAGLTDGACLDRLSVHRGSGARVADSLRAESTWPHTTELIVLFGGELTVNSVLHTLEEILIGLNA
ncbi:LLM class flavin-dependent oxidoreductase [Streptomyces sp. NBRC 109706]|uniref:LLM class flavin-dependent oxidoreductase n=1 Tax=Streptomyces sp. NBRC 109706 TaxID=1550035 RepID=UPI000786268B|nr:LLM class flavin-dependent oxidoreductase [Streptomyces sp. NBRC 109706]